MTNDNPLPGLPTAPVGNPEIIGMLEQALGRARAGKTAGLAIVETFGPDALSCKATGMFGPTLAAGCRKLGRQLEDSLFAQPSRIVRPGRMS